MSCAGQIVDGTRRVGEPPTKMLACISRTPKFSEDFSNQVCERNILETERNDRNCKLHEFCNLKIIFPEVRSSSLQIRRSNILFDRVTLKIFQKFNPGNLNFLSDTRFFEIASRRNFHLVRTFLSIQNSTMNETHMIDRSCQLFANFCTTIFHNSCSPQLWEESLYLGPRCERVMNGIQLGRG